MVQGFLFWVLGPWSHMMGVAKLEYHALLCEIIPSLLSVKGTFFKCFPLRTSP